MSSNFCSLTPSTYTFLALNLNLKNFLIFFGQRNWLNFSRFFRFPHIHDFLDFPMYMMRTKQFGQCKLHYVTAKFWLTHEVLEVSDCNSGVNFDPFSGPLSDSEISCREMTPLFPRRRRCATKRSVSSSSSIPSRLKWSTTKLVCPVYATRWFSHKIYSIEFWHRILGAIRLKFCKSFKKGKRRLNRTPVWGF